jgi:SAM-dependent methyltransferase
MASLDEYGEAMVRIRSIIMAPMTDDERSRLVAAGYDAITDLYLAWSGAISDPHRTKWLERFSANLQDGAAVLELGCGQGGPSTVALAGRFRVHGVDLSAGQIDRARHNVPGATFDVADMRSAEFDEARFDGIAAFYSIIHVPREDHAALYRRIAAWLRPGGWFLASLGAADDPGWTGAWLGVPMFFSSFDANTNLSLLAAAGLSIEAHEIATLHEPEGDARFLWVLAQRPMSRAPGSGTITLPKPDRT